MLLHGLTATRRYVVMGSRVLERSGMRVIAYDARGHGRSTPAPDRGAYGYERLARDLQAVLDALEHRARGPGRRLDGRAHGRCASRCAPRARRGAGADHARLRPRRAHARTRRRSPAGTRSREGLREGGVEGFVARVRLLARCPTRGATTVEAGRAPAAVRARASRGGGRRAGSRAALAAVRADRASWPRSQAPTVVVASRDEADPGHPLAVGERYAQAIPGARLVVEDARADRRWPGRVADRSGRAGSSRSPIGRAEQRRAIACARP